MFSQKIFISYRPDGGYATLTQISELLNRYGYKVLFNTENFCSDSIRSKVLDFVRSSNYFLLLLSKYSLDTCDDPNDELRKEIETAVNNCITVIVIEDSNFIFPQSLPDSLKFLVNYPKKILLDMKNNNLDDIVIQLHQHLIKDFFMAHNILVNKRKVLERPEELKKKCKRTTLFTNLFLVVTISVTVLIISICGYSLADHSSLSDNSLSEKLNKNSTQIDFKHFIQKNNETISINNGLVQGNNNIIYGFDNKIKGNNNIVNGDNYSIDGNNNTVYGNNRLIQGNNNIIVGSNYSINGNNNIIHGDNQIIRGKNNVVKNAGKKF